MSKTTTRWKDRGFDDKYHYAGWLHFNDLADECKMHDDVYFDPYSGRVVNITDGESEHERDIDEDAADAYLSNFDKK